MVDVNICYKDHLGLVLSVKGYDDISNQNFVGLFRFDGQLHPMKYTTSSNQKLPSTSRAILCSYVRCYFDKSHKFQVNDEKVAYS